MRFILKFFDDCLKTDNVGKTAQMDEKQNSNVNKSINDCYDELDELSIGSTDSIPKGFGLE